MHKIIFDDFVTDNLNMCYSIMCDCDAWSAIYGPESAPLYNGLFSHHTQLVSLKSLFSFFLINDTLTRVIWLSALVGKRFILLEACYSLSF